MTYNDQDALALSPEWQVVTNFVVVPEYYENEADRKGVDRYQHLQQQLGSGRRSSAGMRMLPWTCWRRWAAAAGKTTTATAAPSTAWCMT